MHIIRILCVSKKDLLHALPICMIDVLVIMYYICNVMAGGYKLFFHVYYLLLDIGNDGVSLFKQSFNNI